jgi:O-antigen/teichoic acid export membrane protein
MSRSRSFLSGALFGYLYQGLTLLVGLWLTPFYLRVLGAHDYGVWLVALQILTFLLFVDFGTLGVLPRDVAKVHGREQQDPGSDELAVLVGQTARVVLLQTAAIGLIVLGLFLFRPAAEAGVRGPLSLVTLVFVFSYPFRIFSAILTGLQDFKYIGQVRTWIWALSTACVVILLIAGARYYALACGWCLQEIGSSVTSCWRLKRIRPDLLGREAWNKAGRFRWRWFTRGFWVSISQFAVWLAGGVDVLIIVKFLGPSIVVVYSCTCKLVSFLQNQPQMLAGIALPGLSHLKASESRERTIRVTTCLTQGMLLIAGAVFCVVVALNQRFVALWVGDKFFGGVPLTVLLALNFIVRLLDYTLTLALFAFGYEKVSAIRFLIEGVISAGLATLLTARLGLAGVMLGFLCGSLFVAVPVDIYFLARELKVSLRQLLRHYVPYLWRSLVVGFLAFALIERLYIPNLAWLVLAAICIGLVYVAVMIPVVRRSDLWDYVRSTAGGLRSDVSRVLSWSSNS